MLHGKNGTGNSGTGTGKIGTGKIFHIGTFIRSVNIITIKSRQLHIFHGPESENLPPPQGIFVTPLVFFLKVSFIHFQALSKI